MSRPSRNTDRLLIRAARELLPETGCSGLNLREVARRAGVNLGMFHYHFGTKDEFLRVVLQEFYEELFEKLQLTIDPKLSPIRNLRETMIAILTFFRDHRDLVFPLLGKDLINGEPAILRFVEANFPRHFKLIAKLVTACQKEGRIRKAHPYVIMTFLAGASAAPLLFGAAAERLPKRGKKGLRTVAETLPPLLLPDEMIAMRVDMALKGASP
ncbi:MAG: TetR/AcrR family transcriptional regulator [Oligoflexia bacterium]|nr:TetR/AcrR family transcriptional regulator [Oligoflexia bacterium]